MIIWFVRGLFILTLLAGAWIFVAGLEINEESPISFNRPAFIAAAFGLGLVVVALDLSLTRKSLKAVGGLFFGLIVGLVGAYALGLIVDLVFTTLPIQASAAFISTVKFAIGLICCYFTVSVILQTKDDVRFVIPYVEFKKQTKGTRPLILDTSVIIDGRIADLCETRLIDNPLIIPRFVLMELQAIADSADKLKRNRGRRGLDMLNRVQTNPKVEIRIEDARIREVEACEDVDQKLVVMAKALDGRIVTNDYNLNKIAQLRGVQVINVNDVANALRPVFMPGETLSVRILKPGEQPGQGVGYLEDGTMVVAEAAADKIGETVVITVTSVLQSSAGRMIFGRTQDAPPSERRRRPSRPASAAPP